MNGKFPDYLPEDIFPEIDQENQESLFEDSINSFEFFESIFMILSLIEDLSRIDKKDGLDLFESSSWQIVTGSIYGLCKKNRRLLIQLMPRSIFDLLPDIAISHSIEIQAEQLERNKVLGLLNAELLILRESLSSVFETGSSFNGKPPYIDEIDEAVNEGTIDENAKLLFEIISRSMIGRSVDYNKDVERLDRVFSLSPFLRFHLWINAVSALALDSSSYPFFNYSYVPARSEEDHISTIYCYKDIISYFTEYVLSRQPEILALLRSFFPEDFFFDIDKKLAWQEMEAFVAGDPDSRSLFFLLEMFLGFFVEEDEQGFSLDVSILIKINESSCIYYSDQDLKDF